MPLQRELVFETELQDGKYWCWAANAYNISRFYNPNTTWTQCSIASKCLAPKDCCRDKGSCDEMYRLNLALEFTGNYVEHNEEIIGIEKIIDIIEDGLVIAIRIYAEGMGHFVTIHGYDNSRSKPYVHVSDPLNEPTFISLEELSFNYCQSGTEWTHTYYTKASDNVYSFTRKNRNFIAFSNEIKPSKKYARNRSFLTENFQKQKHAHESFGLSFKSLLVKKPEIHKIGIRLIAQNENSDYLIFEYGKDNDSLLQIRYGQDSNEKYIKVLETVISKYDDNDNLELRVLRQPQIRLEAFWLHDLTNSVNDLFFPLRSIDTFAYGKPYNSKDFFKVLSIQASEMKISDDRESGG